VEYFINKPAEGLIASGPILWVIDGLEAIKDRGSILRALSTLLAALPRGVKILVTSTIEPDIYHAFNAHRHIYAQYLHEFDDSMTRRDVSSFIGDRLDLYAIVRGKPALSSLREHFLLLKTADEAYFAWATVATSVIYVLTGAQMNLDKELLSCISTAPSLAELCKSFLQILPPGYFSRVSNDELLLTSADSAETTMVYMGILQLLHGVHTFSPQLCQTVGGCIVDEGSTKNLSVVPHSELQVNLAQACLRVMTDGLRFNVTQCHSSHLANDDQSSANLDHGLIYACLFWVDHLSDTRAVEGFHRQLHHFVFSKLLFWLEAMSVLGKIDAAAAMLRKCLTPDFTKVRDSDARIPMSSHFPCRCIVFHRNCSASFMTLLASLLASAKR
jgi:hypothetical protein